MFVFFFNDTATAEIYTLSLHDALPISRAKLGSFVTQYRDWIGRQRANVPKKPAKRRETGDELLNRAELAAKRIEEDRKSTRLNSSHANISYALFCLIKIIVL